jgi:ornithine cyclodeaminase
VDVDGAALHPQPRATVEHSAAPAPDREDLAGPAQGAEIDLARGEFEMPVRTALRDGQFMVMPARHRPTATAVVKTLSVNFGRTPAIAGTVVWSETGRPDHLVADAGAETTLRTGAAVGVATDLLASPEAGSLTLMGVGGQAPDQVRAVHAVRPLRRLTVVDTDPRRAQALVETLGPELDGAQLLTATDVESAVRDVAIVCCATNATSPLFPDSALPARVQVNAIGAYCLTDCSPAAPSSSTNSRRSFRSPVRSFTPSRPGRSPRTPSRSSALHRNLRGLRQADRVQERRRRHAGLGPRTSAGRQVSPLTRLVLAVTIVDAACGRARASVTTPGGSLRAAQPAEETA